MKNPFKYVENAWNGDDTRLQSGRIVIAARQREHVAAYARSIWRWLRKTCYDMIKMNYL